MVAPTSTPPQVARASDGGVHADAGLDGKLAAGADTGNRPRLAVRPVPPGNYALGMSTTAPSPTIRVKRVPWPARDGEVVRVYVGDAASPHEVFHIAVSGTAIAVLGNHGVQFDIVSDVRVYLDRPGTLNSLLRESKLAREREPDRFFEKAFSSCDLGDPIRPNWMR